MDARLAQILDEIRTQNGRVVVLTGAGISAESGIPTFRGEEGFWVVGSRNYMPQEMATMEMFRRAPDEVWRWYLHRFGVVHGAQPNDGHHALVRLDRALGDRFHLVTQNIDGLHLRAGATPARTYAIHGEAAFVRCARECGAGKLPMPAFDWSLRTKNAAFSDEDRRTLTCPRCRGWLRPHVLWFDEYYDEENYRADSALAAASAADLLLVVGTTGATTLPMRIGMLAARTGRALINVDPYPNTFAELCESSPRGFFAQGAATAQLPAIVDRLIGD